jgi:hypothetical protein
MIPSILEKVSFGAAVIVLVMEGRMHKADLVFVGTDLLLGVLSVIAYLRTRARSVEAARAGISSTAEIVLTFFVHEQAHRRALKRSRLELRGASG